jgi:predicted component of type VI protein secretion system
LFKIGPDKYAACRRWLALFGLESAFWSEEMLYPLALLAPVLARMAGREVGIRLAFLFLLGLPVHAFRYHSAYRRLDLRQHSLLGYESSRLGRDFLIGDRQLDANSITIELGPVSLDTYTDFQSKHGLRLISMILDICVSAYQNHSIAWLVGDSSKAPRLGFAAKNGRIGLNFHLGKGASA